MTGLLTKVRQGTYVVGLTHYKVLVELFGSSTTITIEASRETIEQYGDVNKMVNEMIKPLSQVRRVIVELLNPYINDFEPEVTYHKEMENRLNKRVEVEYTFGDKERFILGRKEGLIPTYVGFKNGNSVKSFSLMTYDIKELLTVQEIETRKDRERYQYDEKYREYRKSLSNKHRRRKQA